MKKSPLSQDLLRHVFPAQREFLEKHGYDAIKSKDTVLLLRPEKYKIKELPK